MKKVKVKTKVKSTGMKSRTKVDSGFSGMPAVDKEWRAQQDLRTMHDAHQIRKDKERHSAVKDLARQQVKALGIGAKRSKMGIGMQNSSMVGGSDE